MIDITTLLRMTQDLFGRAQLPPPPESLPTPAGEPPTTVTVNESIGLADPAQDCLPQLPLPPRTRIWIRIVIFVITAGVMISLLAIGLQVAAAAAALIYIGVIAIWVANRIMATVPRTRLA